jgi:hypothetical protein
MLPTLISIKKKRRNRKGYGSKEKGEGKKGRETENDTSLLTR